MRDELTVVLGRCEDGRDLVLDLADSGHLALQGQTRSGKSCVLYILLARLSMMGSVLVAGIDPTGILLAPLQERPDADLRCLGTANMDQAATVAEAVMAMMDQRISDLLDSGHDKISIFTEETPLIALILEEYPGTLSAAEAEDIDFGRKGGDRASARIQRCVRRLIQEGAKVGIRVAMVAQRMDAAIVGGAERSNLAVRISMRVDNTDALRMLHPSATPDVLARVSGFTPGMGLVETPGDGLRVFKADYCDYSGYVQLVRRGDVHARHIR